ncbi:MAG: molybdenum cofactor guanylyltransferase [Desulfobacteraceae bacterium]|jgi:molybdopterin-guanine dinucleotide biosynthesis protein A
MDEEPMDDVCGVILAGGRSSRMGRDKAMLDVSGLSMFERTLHMMRELFKRIIIAGDRPDLSKADVPCYKDIYPGSALGGLYTGLKEAGTEWIMVSACDMPFPDVRIARFLLDQREDYDVVVPKTPGGYEPLFAVYRKTCLPYMKELLDKNIYKINDFYAHVRVRYVFYEELPEGWEHALLNVNTPEQYLSVKENS